MIKKNFIGSLSGLFILALAVMPAFSSAAALIDIGVGTYGSKVNLNTQPVVEVDTDDVDVDAETRLNAGSEARSAQTGSAIEAGKTLRINRESIRANAQAEANADANANLGEGSDIDGPSNTGAPTNATSSANANVNALANASARSSITDPSHVLSADDLEVFASSTLLSDENMEEVVFTSDTVELSYAQRGRLLGLFPVTFNAIAVAKADGTVEVRYPWYAFVVDKDKAELEEGLRASVEEIRAEARANSQAAFNASEQAMIAANMHSVLQASSSTEADEQ